MEQTELSRHQIVIFVLDVDFHLRISLFSSSPHPKTTLGVAVGVASSLIQILLPETVVA